MSFLALTSLCFFLCLLWISIAVLGEKNMNYDFRYGDYRGSRYPSSSIFLSNSSLVIPLCSDAVCKSIFPLATSLNLGWAHGSDPINYSTFTPKANLPHSQLLFPHNFPARSDPVSKLSFHSCPEYPAAAAFLFQMFPRQSYLL